MERAAIETFSLREVKMEFEFNFYTTQVDMKLPHILASWMCGALDVRGRRSKAICRLGHELVPFAEEQAPGTFPVEEHCIRISKAAQAQAPASDKRKFGNPQLPRSRTPHRNLSATSGC